MSLLLVRHGQSEGNARGVIQGQRDLPLTERGVAQARAAGERLCADGGADRIVASQLARAFATAEIIARSLDLPVTTEARLMEYDFGEVSGLTLPQARARYPDWSWALEHGGQRPLLPGEEGLPAFDARVAAVLADLMAPAGRTIAVTHGGVIMSVLNRALGGGGEAPRLRFRIANCAITELEHDAAGRLVVRRHNDACHLPPPRPAASPRATAAPHR